MMLVLGSLLLALAVGFAAGVLWTLRWFGAIVLALVVAGPAQAQTLCDETRCVYDFSVPSEDGWKDWARWGAAAVSSVGVSEGTGRISITMASPFHKDNAEVLYWPATEGFSRATADLAFVAEEDPDPRWSQVYVSGKGQCALGHPVAVADAVFILWIYRLAGVFVGNPYSIRAQWPHEERAEEFVSLGVIQQVGLRYVKTGVMVLPVLALHDLTRVSIQVVGAEVLFSVEMGGKTYPDPEYGPARVPLLVPPGAGPAGVTFTTTPASLCTGWRSRRVEVYSVEASR